MMDIKKSAKAGQMVSSQSGGGLFTRFEGKADELFDSVGSQDSSQGPRTDPEIYPEVHSDEGPVASRLTADAGAAE